MTQTTQGARGSRAAATMGGEMSIKHTPDGSLVITHKPEGAAEMGAEPLTAGMVKTDAATVAATATGTAIGALTGGPLGAAIGAGVGAAIDWYRHKQKAAKAAAVLAAARAANAGPNPLAGLGTVNLKPIAVKTITKAAPPTYPKLKLLKMATNANLATHPSTTNPDPNTVAAKNAADALYNYLQQYPYDRQVLGGLFWNSAKTGTLVKAFQSAYNADTATNDATGPIAASGIYDAKTAAALTFYTHNPVDPDPNA